MTPAIRAALNSPCTSYWLKNALTAALNRDIVDATNDAETLAKLLAALLATVQP